LRLMLPTIGNEPRASRLHFPTHGAFAICVLFRG
jgi:hypothetical protein